VPQQLEQLDAGSRVAAAEALVHSFLERTGALGHGPSRRYLWTDAYAVLALVGLHRRTSRQDHLDAALALAQRVHEELGRFRPDDPRVGWISGLPEDEGRRRPTAGGLRIGKPQRERPPGAALDERREWDRDGQYFHYLTKWMVALNRLAHATANTMLNDWAVDLALASWPAFSAPADLSGTPRMHWKMSTDLSRPLVASMGHHDPLDGLATFAEIRASQRTLGGRHSHGAIDEAWADMHAMCERSYSWATSDALGVGGMLQAVETIARLTASGECEAGPILDRVLVDCARSLDYLVTSGEMRCPPRARLAFRELGLAIGIHGIEPMRRGILHAPARFGPVSDLERRLGCVQAMMERAGAAEEIERQWLDPAAHASSSWRSHEDINCVMLAASLVPDACIAP
jgi:hypothetical protein